MNASLKTTTKLKMNFLDEDRQKFVMLVIKPVMREPAAEGTPATPGMASGGSEERRGKGEDRKAWAPASLDLHGATRGDLVHAPARKHFPQHGWFMGSVTSFNTRRNLYRWGGLVETIAWPHLCDGIV